MSLKSGWRGFWARPVISHEISKPLQSSCDPDVRFQSVRVVATLIEISRDFWAACLGLKRGWRGFWARFFISHEMNKLLQIS